MPLSRLCCVLFSSFFFGSVLPDDNVLYITIFIIFVENWAFSFQFLNLFVLIQVTSKIVLQVKLALRLLVSSAGNHDPGQAWQIVGPDLDPYCLTLC